MEEISKLREGGIRQLIELAVSSGRAFQSAQTGYVHYCYHPIDEESNQTTPVYENVLFALALLRTKSSDHMLEAKAMIERLLHFQCLEEGMSCGNFPIYLHEYPQCKDRFLGASLLGPFYWILKQFHQVLGNELKMRLETAVIALLKNGLKMHKEKPAPYGMAVRIAAAAKVFGEYFHQSDWEKEGTAMLDALCHSKEIMSWFSPAAIADILIGLQMVYPSLIGSPWDHFWKHLVDTWHVPSCSYAGPALKEFQSGEEPQSTLYDLYMGYFSQQYSFRAFDVHPFQLEGILIQPTEDRIPQAQYPFIAEGTINDRLWSLRQESHYAYAVIQRKEINPAVDKSFYPFKLVWGDRNRAHTFVSQGGNYLLTEFHVFADRIEMMLDLGENVDLEEREKNREIEFYLDLFEGQEIRVQGQPSTTFQLNEDVEFHSRGMKVVLNLSMIEGDGKFLGHIMRGNRPSQLEIKGKHRFDAYDTQFFLRTLRRSYPCRIKAVIRL